MKRFFGLLYLLVACLSFHTVVQAEEKQEKATSVQADLFPNEEFRWASDGEANVPYVFHDPLDTNHIIGFEYELMAKMSEQMGVKSTFVQNGWDGLIPGLSRNLYQAVIDGLEITPEHEKAVLFTRPYYITAEKLIVRKENEARQHITSLDALEGLKVGSIKNTPAARMIETAGGTFLGYDEETDLFADLRSRRLDAILIDEPIARYYLTSGLLISDASFGKVSYGIAIAKNNPKLRNELNNALTKVMQNGDLHRILARWNLWTPTMAAYSGDHSETTQAPDAWDDYHREMDAMTGTSFKSILLRDLTFLPAIGRGAVMTVAVSVLGMVIAVSFGVLLALTRQYGHPILRGLAVLYIETVRGTPLLIQILFIFYALPAGGITLSPFWAGVGALGLNYAAYEAENYRAGLASVPKGQMEAAQALNLTRFQALRYVITPQAFRSVLPVMVNDFISLLKDSSLVSVITLTDLTQVYVRLSATYYDYIGPGLMVAIAYLLLGLPFVRLANYAERRIGKAMVQGGGHH
ncbi:transporter substrate-binding domain-containing protein [Acetobacteraceae bacterium]|nr:transporter substrate-binding domain-containing protein [Acetobacteraceae bacterium]